MVRDADDSLTTDGFLRTVKLDLNRAKWSNHIKVEKSLLNKYYNIIME